jgi:GT2 family glycosyltransferase
MSRTQFDGTIISFDHASDPVVSVVVIGWKDAPQLLHCLASLSTAKIEVPFEVILTLNEPTPQLLESVSRFVSGLESVVQNLVNTGFGEANNRGVAEARAPFIQLLNDDVIVTDGWLDEALKVLRSDPQIGAVGSVLMNPDGSLQDAGGLVFSDANVVVLNYSIMSEAQIATRPVHYCSAASFLIERALFERVGGFDSGYFPAYFEDVDLCFKIRSSGEEIWIVSESRVVHEQGVATSYPFQKFLHERGSKRFSQRWAASLQQLTPSGSQAFLDEFLVEVRNTLAEVPELAKGADWGGPATINSQVVWGDDEYQKLGDGLQQEFEIFLDDTYQSLSEEVVFLRQDTERLQRELEERRLEIAAYKHRFAIRLVDLVHKVTQKRSRHR